MTGTLRCIRQTLRSQGDMIGADSGRKLRALIPPITPKMIFRALLGVLLFLCGILVGVWIIFRSRRHG